jgi:nitrogen fixation protein FixH
MDFTEEYNRIMRGGEFGEETGWKIMALIVMFFSLITLLHKPISMLLGN